MRWSETYVFNCHNFLFVLVLILVLSAVYTQNSRDNLPLQCLITRLLILILKYGIFSSKELKFRLVNIWTG
jgi:hypothetical protein